MKTMLTKMLAVILAVMIVIPVSAAYADCPNCGKYCSFTVGYDQWTANQHGIRGWCSGCGKDIWQGTNAGSHTMSNGVCTLCGYNDGSGSGGSGSGSSGGGSTTCSHPGTATSWEGCTWYQYCTTCYLNLNSGVSHSYAYYVWEYYNSSQHRQLYGCTSCGEGTYEYGYHSTSTRYGQYSSTQHTVGSYCATCFSYIGSKSYENHDFSYGSWTNYSDSQHRRSVYCSDCGYSDYEYAGHSLSYGSWTSTGSSQHKRTVSCSCGYSTTEYASHSLTNGSWTSTGSSQHKRTVSCSCGYSTTETKSHNLTYGAWTKYSGTRHKRAVSCSDCSYSTTEYADHSLSYSDWESYDELEHCRDASCSTCGYSTVEYADHSLTKGDWKEYSDTQHSRTVSCSCGYNVTEYADHEDTDYDGYCDGCGYLMTRFSVTLPTVMLIVMAEDGWVYTASNAEIVNNSTHSVEITSVTITAGDNWTLVPYGWNMADEKVDSRLIGFYLNGAESTRTGGSENLTLPDIWTIDRDDSFVLDYDAVVSATSDVLKNEQVLTLVFVVDWLYL